MGRLLGIEDGTTVGFEDGSVEGVFGGSVGDVEGSDVRAGVVDMMRERAWKKECA